MGMVKGLRPNGDNGICSLCIDPTPLKIQDPFNPTSPEQLQGRLQELYTTVTFTVCEHGGPYCSVRVQTEDMLNELLCLWFSNESYSAWLWPEAAIGCVINQKVRMANERLQHWKPETEHIWLFWTP